MHSTTKETFIVIHELKDEFRRMKSLQGLQNVKFTGIVI